MRNLTIMAVLVLIGAVMPVNADYSFPSANLLVDDHPQAMELDVSTVPAGDYASFVLTVDWSAVEGSPFAEEAMWTLECSGLPVLLIDSRFNTVFQDDDSSLTWSGVFTQTYTGGSLTLRAAQQFQGSSANWENITLTIIEGTVPPAMPPAAVELGQIASGITTGCDTLTSNGVAWFSFSTDAVTTGDCDTLRIDTLGSILTEGIYGDGNDTEIALYDATGLFIGTNDDIDQLGGELLSMLAFGADEGLAPTSRDLPAGTYYLAVAGFDAGFGLSGFEVYPSSAVIGNVAVNVTQGMPLVDCNLNGQADVCDISQGSSFDVNSNGIPDECEDCNDNGILDTEEITQGTSADCNGNSVPDECELESGIERLYVDHNAEGLNDGESWEDAYTSLQDAIHRADCASGITEIWVAAGTYTPAYGTPQRSDTFRLVSGVKIYGGFAGGETELQERNVGENVAVLSGDLAGNDEEQAGLASHCYYLAQKGVAEDYCDQFDVDGDSYLREYEIGIDENAYCVVTASGVNSDTLLDGFTITGGNGGSSEFLIGHGGGMFVRQSDLVVANCRFRTNQADNGGALAITEGQPVFVNCEFSGNRSWQDTGGVVVVWVGSATFTNCIIVHNFNARYVNGGLLNQAGNLYDIAGYEVETVIYNSIIRENACSDPDCARQILDDGMTIVAYTCTKRGLYEGFENIDIDPLFVDPLGPDGVPGTGDEDYRLQIGSPLINYGDDSAVPAGMDTDLDGFPRIGACVVDLGPYENQEFHFLGDADENCVIDIADYTDFKFCLERFGYERSPILDACTRVFDSDGDNDVDLADFAAFQRLFHN